MSRWSEPFCEHDRPAAYCVVCADFDDGPRSVVPALLLAVMSLAVAVSLVWAALMAVQP